jgi:hypothetical protein
MKEIIFVVGVFLCWLAYFTGDKVKRGVASLMPASKGVRQVIGFLGIASAVVFSISVIYGFWIFDWWVPIIAILVVPLSGVIYVWFGFLLEFAIVSVPTLLVLGSLLLAYVLL